MNQLQWVLNRRRHAVALGAVIFATGCIDTTAYAQDPPCYEVAEIILGPQCPNGDPAVMVPWAMNDEGWVTGYYGCVPGPEISFIWPGQGPPVAIPMPPGTSSSNAYDINSEGRIVGRLSGDGPFAFLYDGVEVTVIEPPPPGYRSEANGVNDDGVVVGAWFSVGGTPAFMWHEGVFTDLGTIPGLESSQAEDINNADPPQITGQRWIEGRGVHMAFILQGEQLLDLGPITGGFDSRGAAINNHGEVTGRGEVPHPEPPGYQFHGFYWSGGVMSDIGTLPTYDRSVAYDINDASQIVGYCSDSDVALDTAFLWQEGTMWDLNDLIPPESSVRLTLAAAINDAGQIVCHADPGATHIVAVLLTPMIADLSGDCIVNIEDLLILLGEWACSNSPADFNNDGTVNVLDLLFLLAEWSS